MGPYWMDLASESRRPLITGKAPNGRSPNGSASSSFIVRLQQRAKPDLGSSHTEMDRDRP